MKRRARVLAVGIPFLTILAFLFTIDKNPATPYHPTDGMLMAIRHDQILKDREGVGLDFSDSPPGTTLADSLGFLTWQDGSPFLGIVVVHYRPSPCPGFLRTPGRWLGFRIPNPTADRQVLALGNNVVSIQGTASFVINQDESMEKANKFRESLRQMEPNGELRLHSNYVAVQRGKEVRVYPLDKLPKSVREFYDFAEELVESKRPPQIR